MVHENSLAAYGKMNLTAAQMKVARAILNETRRGRAATIDSLFHRYGILPNSSGRITELKRMAADCIAFEIDGEEWALVCVGRETTASGNTADAFQLEKFSVVRAKYLQEKERREAITGKQATMF